MRFLIEFPPHNPFAQSTLEHLTDAKARLETGLKDGRIECFYSKVGGGGFMVVNTPSPETLRRVLRLSGVVNAEVTPVDKLEDVIQGYIDYHKLEANKPAHVVEKAKKGAAPLLTKKP